jgi:hypothetical protein
MTGMQFLAVDSGVDLEKDKFTGIIGLSPSHGVSHLDGFLY